MTDSSTSANSQPSPESALEVSSTTTRLKHSCWILGSSLLLLLIIFGVYSHALNSGFTLDDFSHIDYAWQTVTGHPEALLAKLFGSWTSGKEDGIIAYRPTTCTTFVIDCAIWQAKAYGWHISNLFFLFVDCLFTGLVAYELIWRAGISRLSAGLAGLLSAVFMALYPGHPDSAVTIVGRVDTLPTAFYLASLYFYMLRESPENGRYKRLIQTASLICFWLALGSKETAVTLPAILLIGELLAVFAAANPVKSKSTEQSAKQRLLAALKATAPYFCTLAAFAVLRTIVLHGQVGGYGKVHFKALLHQLLGFADRATLCKIFLPINEHFPLPESFTRGMLLVYAVAALNILSQAARNKKIAQLSVFLLLFAIANVLLTFQIWHIYPNLVGFRLFFLSSCALAIALAIGLPLERKNWATSFLNLLAAGFLCVLWTNTLASNIQPFQTAGSRLARLQIDLNALADNNAGGRRILIQDLPQDYCGAPMVGRAAFLNVLLKPPLNKRDITSNFVIKENGSGKLLELDTLVEPTAQQGMPMPMPIYTWDSDKAFLQKLGD